MKQLSKEESQVVFVVFLEEIVELWLMRGLKLGFLGGLTVGWIAGGLVMLWLS